jgi:HK97 family phage prohead protease
MERKDLLLLPDGNAAIKAIAEGNGYIEGYAAVKGNADSYNDIIRDGAFQNLEKLVGSGFFGKSHEWDDAIGYVVEAKEDQIGLWVKMAFHSTPDAQEARVKIGERLAAGKSVGLSIGYFTKEASYGTADGQDVRYLDAVEVFEVSFVTMPANERAQVLNFKGRGVPREKQFDDLAAEVEDYTARLAEISESRGDEWKAARVLELDALASKVLTLADSLREAPTEEPQAFDSFPEGWEGILAEAQKLTQ